MILYSFNVTGDGAAHAISSIAGAPTQCKWFQFLCASGTLTIGGPAAANVDATHGYPIVAAGANFQPPIALPMDFYDLTSIFYFLSNTDTAVLLCGV